jgi:hypothetical protein
LSGDAQSLLLARGLLGIGNGIERSFYRGYEGFTYTDTFHNGELSTQLSQLAKTDEGSKAVQAKVSVYDEENREVMLLPPHITLEDDHRPTNYTIHVRLPLNKGK